MNSVIVFLLVLSVVVIKNSSAITLDELKTLMVESAKQCVEETKVTTETLAKIMKYETITDREGKCFKACMMEHMGIMGPDHKINRDKVLDEAKNLFNANEDKIAIAGDIIGECNQHSETDKCEAANMIAECIFKHKNAAVLKEIM